MSDIRYWLWLQRALGVGAAFKPIIEEFGSVEALFRSNLLEMKMSSALTASQVSALAETDIHETESILYTCRENGWRVISFDDDAYPQRLREIINPPAVLFVDGEWQAFDAFATIGIVGTRKASTYACKAASVMAKGISLCGALTVSGGALGVDAAAHQGALAAGGKTYAVLGNGFGTRYLEANRALRQQIRQQGALITEFPPFTEVRRQNFPFRNRIISGLSDGVLVVEAGIKSGSLITAKHAYEQGRDIFAVPASIFDYHFYGTNQLIDDGATVATSPSVLLAPYAERYETLDMSRLQTVRELTEQPASANVPKQEQVAFDEIARDRYEAVRRQESVLALSGDEAAVYAALQETYESVEYLLERTQLPSQKVLTALTMLEMKGLAENASGKRYRKTG